jgi:hypothetical protein
MKVYYAHPVSLYGKNQEKLDHTTLRLFGFEVVCPNSPACDEGYKNHGMGFFKDIVKGCDALAFRGLPGGKIPAGVAFEIQIAKEAGLPIIELPCSLMQRTLNVEQTREALMELGR